MKAPFTERVHPSWAKAFEPHIDVLARIEERLTAESAADIAHFPSDARILRAFEQPVDSVKVVIVGQDPYPTPGHAVGLSFSVERDARPIPRSLENIFRELHDDLGIKPALHGDLSAWSHSGVLLLNRVLTVRSGAAGSHRGIGWENITASALTLLANRGGPLVAVLWGKDAQTVKPLLGDVAAITSAHPSPLSAHNGFFGSRPFSRVNDSLVAQGGTPIDWRV